MRRLFLSVALLAVIWPNRAAAEESIIKNPGEHTRYGIEFEPHALLGYGGHGLKSGMPGIGARGTFILVENGFVPSINNNVGLGLGIDVFPSRTVVLDIPFVLQWNFFLSTHFSVFGEPGLGILYSGDGVLHPVLYGGGRFHFTESIALTVRLGYPSGSVGVSFLL